MVVLQGFLRQPVTQTEPELEQSGTDSAKLGIFDKKKRNKKRKKNLAQ